MLLLTISSTIMYEATYQCLLCHEDMNWTAGLDKITQILFPCRKNVMHAMALTEYIYEESMHVSQTNKTPPQLLLGFCFVGSWRSGLL